MGPERWAGGCAFKSAEVFGGGADAKHKWLGFVFKVFEAGQAVDNWAGFINGGAVGDEREILGGGIAKAGSSGDNRVGERTGSHAGGHPIVHARDGAKRGVFNQGGAR